VSPKFFLLLISLSASSSLPAKNAPPAPATASLGGLTVSQGTILDHPEWRYWQLRPDLGKTRLAVSARDGGGSFLAALVPAGALAAVNGGYFAPDFKPTGWVQDGSRIYRKKRLTTKGGVVAVQGRRVYIGPQAALPFEPELVVQNGPLLLEAGAKIGIRSDDGRRAARTVACVTAGAGELQLIVILAEPKQGPTLLETATLLKAAPAAGGFGCERALNLDGGPSSGLWLAPEMKLPAAAPAGPIGYALVIAPSTAPSK
jgi:hypothetical protein